MIAPLSLSNWITVILALICLWTVANQTRGAVIKTWRLALPPCFAAVNALVLLAGVFEANFEHDAEWLLAALVGAFFGRMRGWTIEVEVDQRRELVRQHRSADGPLMAIALLLLSFADFIGAALVDPVIEPQHVAAGAALCAGWLGARALAIGVRTTRLPHVELSSI
jgi:membrane protein CcdC involved in cytochrome C biogenesis